MTNKTKGTVVGLSIICTVLVLAVIFFKFMMDGLDKIDYSPPPGYECYNNILVPSREIKFRTIAVSDRQWCGLTEDQKVICWRAEYCENKTEK